jgi:Tfp pilus assembly protein PilF
MISIVVVLLATFALVGCGARGARFKVDQGRDTEGARALNDRAFELIGQGKYDHAEKLLKQAIADDVMFGPARNNLGLVYYQTNRLYQAAWEFQNAIKLMPHQPAPRNNLGLVLERAGKLEGAAESYAEAREIEPDNPEFIGNLARAKLRRGERDEETRKLLEELVLKDPRPEWTHWARMNLLRLEATVPAEPATLPSDE